MPSMTGSGRPDRGLLATGARVCLPDGARPPRGLDAGGIRVPGADTVVLAEGRDGVPATGALLLHFAEGVVAVLQGVADDKYDFRSG
jgi:hypothetical protein